VFGNYRAKGIEKGGYILNRNLMTVADLSRLINSDQVQSKLRTVRKSEVKHDLQKRNPLKNRALMKKLNPFSTSKRDQEKKLQDERHKKRAAAIKAKRSKSGRKDKQKRTKTFRGLEAGLVDSYAQALEVLRKEEALGKAVAEGEEDDE